MVIIMVVKWIINSRPVIFTAHVARMYRFCLVYLSVRLSVCPSGPGCLSGAFCPQPTHRPMGLLPSRPIPPSRRRRAVRSSLELILIILTNYEKQNWFIGLSLIIWSKYIVFKVQQLNNFAVAVSLVIVVSSLFSDYWACRCYRPVLLFWRRMSKDHSSFLRA